MHSMSTENSKKQVDTKIETNRRRYTRQQQETKSAFRPVDEPLITRGSTTDFVPLFEFDCSCFQKKGPRKGSRFAGGKELESSFCVIDLKASRPILPCAAPLPHRAPL